MAVSRRAAVRHTTQAQSQPTCGMADHSKEEARGEDGKRPVETSRLSGKIPLPAATIEEMSLYAANASTSISWMGVEARGKGRAL
jgi:hypothetical protein